MFRGRLDDEDPRKDALVKCRRRAILEEHYRGHWKITREECGRLGSLEEQ